MKTLVTIMAHEGAQEIFDRHMPFWMAHGHDMMVYCPEDSRVKTELPMVCKGTASHHDSMANWRFRRLLHELSSTTYQRFIIYEYDAICITEEIPGIDHIENIAGNVFRDTTGEFKGTTYIHPPLVITRLGLDRLLAASVDIPDCAEGGFWDRWLGLLVEISNIQPDNFLVQGTGYSRNTIEYEHWDAAKQAAKAGAVLFHGVKSPQALQVIKTGREMFLAENK